MARSALQQAALALEELQGPGFLIGGVMHYRIGLILPKLNEAIDALSAPPAQPANIGCLGMPVNVPVTEAQPAGWLYDWTHSSALGRPDEDFTAFTKDEARARSGVGNRNVRPVYAAPPAQPAAPAGWKLVPVEPTEAMCAAAVKFANGNAVYKNVAAEALKIEEAIYGEAYSAMLAAAPGIGEGA